MGETSDQREARLAGESLRKRIKREEETPEERNQRLSNDSLRHTIKREEETPEEREQRLSENALRTRIKREQEEPEERDQRRSENAVRMRFKREEETPSQAGERRRRDRTQHRARYQPRLASAACRRRHIDENGYVWACGSEFAGHWPLYMRLPTFGTKAAGEPNRCCHCNALLFEGEQSNECCMYGEVHCDPLPDAPELIKYLCDPTIRSPEGTNFRQHTNAYNVAVSFGSLSTVTQQPHGVGQPVVLMNGQQSQQIGNVVLGRDPQGRQKDPLFGQVYVLNDVAAATGVRMNMPIARQLDPNVMRQLEVLIRSLNPFAQHLVALGQQLAEADIANVTLNFRLSILDHRPAPGQVCALFESGSDDPPNPANSGIWIKSAGNSLKKIDIWNRNADWLLFTIMFPRATQTYGRGIPRHSLRQIQDLPVDDDVEMLEAVAATEGGDMEMEVDTDTTPVAEPTTSGNQEDHPTAQIPETEPPNWDDQLETTDVVIPANVVQQAEPEAFHAAADFGELRDAFAEDVIMRTGATQGLITALLAGEEQCLDANELDAYLCALIRLSRRPTAVVRTSFGTAEQLLALQHDRARAEEQPLAAIDHVYGEIDDPQLAAVLIPRHTFVGLPGQVNAATAVGHFTLGVYYPESGELHHFDSLQNPLDDSAGEYYRRVVETLNPPDQRRFHLRAITARPNHTYNRQDDGTSCGFWVALNAEMVLTRGIGYTYLPNFGARELQRERTRILSFLHALLGGHFPDYRPPPPSQCRETAEEQHRPIGDHVPYNTDVHISDSHVAPACNDEPTNGRSRVNEFKYRARTRGPAKFASRRDYLVYQLQRRDVVGTHHPLLSYGPLTQKYVIRQAWLTEFNVEEHQRRLQNTSEWRRTIRSEFLEYHQRNLQRSRRDDPSAERLKIGRVYQMPKTIRQSPGNIHLNITRAMAIRKAVNPKCGMFVTLTFNCKCVEIVELIGTTANPADYPDLCCRAASAKFKQMLQRVNGPNGLLGPVKAYIWSLEYQKRGNKHWY